MDERRMTGWDDEKVYFEDREGNIVQLSAIPELMDQLEALADLYLEARKAGAIKAGESTFDETFETVTGRRRTDPNMQSIVPGQELSWERGDPPNVAGKPISPSTRT